MKEQKFSEDLRQIRLIYVGFEKFTRYGTNDTMLGKTYGVSSPFTLPEGMTIEQACKVISYLSEKVENENNIGPASEKSVAKVSGILTDYGFVKNEGFPHGYFHIVQEYPEDGKIIGEQPINGVIDLFTVGGDFELFKKSNLYDRYFDWFADGVTKKEIKEILGNVIVCEDKSDNVKAL